MSSKKSSQKQGGDNTPQILTKVPPHMLANLLKHRAKHIAASQADRVQYPDPDELHLLDAAKIKKLGFIGHDLGDLIESAEGMEDYRGSRRRGRGRQRQRRGSGQQGGQRQPKSKGGKKPSGGGGRGKTLPNAATVAAEVKTEIANSGLKSVGMTGDVIWAEQNLEFGDRAKIKYFRDSYSQIIPLGHIWLLAEVGKDGVDELATLTGYQGFSSDENTRGQAVGILVHERFEVIGDPEQIKIDSVQGVPDLRNALLVHLRDKTTKEEFWACAVHLKSMRGGEKVTQAVRYQQADILAQNLSGKGNIGGDWNCKFPGAFSADLLPLKNAGFVLVDPTNTEWTQSMGSWLDAFLQLNMNKALGKMVMIKWFQKLSSGRAFTDHALVTSK